MDDFQYTTDMQSTANAMVLDGKGNLYVAGTGWTKRGTRWIVRQDKREESGNWKTVDDYVSEKSVFGATPQAMAIDLSDNIYIAGWESLSYPDKQGYRHYWIVRRGTQNSWETIDSFRMEEGGSGLARGITVDRSGNIYVVGEAYEVFGESSWIVRKGSVFDVKQWKTIDQFRYEGKSSSALGVTLDPFGNLYVIGRSDGKWLVRKSEDKGDSWKLIDIFQYSEGKAAYPSAIASNRYGQIFAAGQGSDEKDTYRWIVRKSEDFGSSWQTVDDYGYEKGKMSYANAIVINTEGRIYVGGSGRSSGFQNPWLVRVSTDKGKTWSVSDEFKYNDGNAADNTVDDVVVAMGLDAGGNPLAAGDVYSSPSRRWVVRGFPCR